MIHALPQRPARFRELLFSPAARPLRFAGTGATAGASQLLLLALLTHHGWNATPANTVGFLAAAQVNFVLSSTLTWRDRHSGGGASDSIPGRWLLFHGSIAVMALVNMLTFTAAQSFLPMTAAAITGIAAGAAGNFLVGDRLIFRKGTVRPTSTERKPAA